MMMLTRDILYKRPTLFEIGDPIYSPAFSLEFGFICSGRLTKKVVKTETRAAIKHLITQESKENVEL